jgi:hypothetical protein
MSMLRGVLLALSACAWIETAAGSPATPSESVLPIAPFGFVLEDGAVAGHHQARKQADFVAALDQSVHPLVEQLMSTDRPNFSREFSMHTLALAFPIGQDDVGAALSLFVANQKTAVERVSDTATRRRRQRGAAALGTFRAHEDANFANRTRILAGRMRDLERFRGPPEMTNVTNGAEFLDALVQASRRKPIKNLVVYGHAASTALFMLEDRGFYLSVGDIAKVTQVVTGADDDKTELLRGLGARDFSDFERLVQNGSIRFANGAVIVFAGCGVAGRRDVERQGLAGRIAALVEATVIASIGVTDQSMARSQKARSREYSRGMWVKFIGNEDPEKLNTKVIDVLRYLVPDEPRDPARPEPVQVESMPTAPAERLHCTSYAATGEAAFCGQGIAPDAMPRLDSKAFVRLPIPSTNISAWLAAFIPRTRSSAPAPRPS